MPSLRPETAAPRQGGQGAEAAQRLRGLTSADPPGVRRADALPAESPSQSPAGALPVSGLADRIRTSISLPAAVALLVVAGVALGAAALVSHRSAPREVAVPERRLPGAGTTPATPASPGSSPAAATLVVDVVGAVAHPGVVRVPQGARVVDALAAAGGAAPGTDLTDLNLARPVRDGEQIRVGLPPPPGGEPAAGSAPGSVSGADGSSGDSSAAALDLNSATAAQLEQLPGVGPVLARRIVEWRTAHGGFRDVQQLRQVSGIGDAKYADIAPRVRV